ncbi:1,4-alpha-glucan branching protein GlgB [Oxalobacteraceae bacterium OM1]|nr:1,4-alpha-glucan branching protein GlgB [Oxalobacteraceae bacterium OM1]
MLAGADAATVDRAAVDALAAGVCADPFALLGPHVVNGVPVVRCFLPGAQCVEVLEDLGASPLVPVGDSGLFTGKVHGRDRRYRLRVTWPDGTVHVAEDPYAFGPLLGDFDLHLFREGRHRELGAVLGAHAICIDGVPGVRFAVWAPHARRVSVVGDFNAWDGRRHVMRRRHEAGVWEVFVPRLAAGEQYRYEIVGADGRLLPLKADPYARSSACPPATSSIVAAPEPFAWSDHEWMRCRAAQRAEQAPISIYEVHAGSWRRDAAGWRALGDALIPYVKALGFTHIELLPVMEHPFGGSWGYQPLGLFAPTARYGTPQDFAGFVDRCHRAGLGVILDWVPAHFPTDEHGLARFDGTALYEHADPREGFHQDWKTFIYNLGRNEVRNFLIASALDWLERFHIDGLRVDAVSSMLYRDYSRAPGEWVPNQDGGRENYEAVAFLRELNAVVRERCPGALVIAEESTAWPGVSAPAGQGGLGFAFKWNMGWMHDTLRYLQRDPVHRRHHHGELGFGLCYAFDERFVLPISHDEVVHGKHSLLEKMPGDDWQKFANLRAFLGFMWTHPGKKLLFMGCEFGQRREWNHDGELDWHLLDDARHARVQRLVRDLNRLYGTTPALHALDADRAGFAWIVGDDARQSVYAFLRQAAGEPPVLVVCNFTPVPRYGYRIGVPASAPGVCDTWEECLNTDSVIYGGSNAGNLGGVLADEIASHRHPVSVALTLPPLSVVVFRRKV